LETCTHAPAHLTATVGFVYPAFSCNGLFLQPVPLTPCLLFLVQADTTTLRRWLTTATALGGRTALPAAPPPGWRHGTAGGLPRRGGSRRGRRYATPLGLARGLNVCIAALPFTFHHTALALPPPGGAARAAHRAHCEHKIHTTRTARCAGRAAHLQHRAQKRASPATSHTAPPATCLPSVHARAATACRAGGGTPTMAHGRSFYHSPHHLPGDNSTNSDAAAGRTGQTPSACCSLAGDLSSSTFQTQTLQPSFIMLSSLWLRTGQEDED